MSTIKFRLKETPHAKGEEAKSYYPIVANEDKFTAEDLCRVINERCTVTEGDIWAVMMNMADVLTEKLANGTRVELPELGTFAPSIVSKEPITDLDDKLIARRLRIDTIDFTPRTALMKRLHEVTFHRAEQMVKRRVNVTDEELMAHIQALCEASPTHSFERSDFQLKTGVSRTTACHLLRELTEKGVLLKQGRKNSPYYAMVKE